jgi:hypothetical protein
MKTKKYILITLLAILAFSCTKLDETLFGQISAEKFPENDAQVIANVLVIYDRLPGWADWAGYFFLQEVTGDAVVCPTRGLDWDDAGKWRQLHEHKWTDRTEAPGQAWGALFEGIGECNKLADAMKSSTDPNTLRNYAIVRAMRAYYYYCAIDFFGDVPYLTYFKGASQRPFKNYRADIFDSLIIELEWVLEHLPNGQGTKATVNKGMVHSLLAKLYLNGEVFTGRNGAEQGFWEKAEAHCDAVIAMGYGLDDIKGPFLTNNRASVENIFVVDYDESLRQGFNLHMRTLHYNSDQTFKMTTGPWNGFCIMPAFFNTYENTDLRKEAWFLHGPQSTFEGAPLMDGLTGERVNFVNSIPALIMTAATHGAHTLRNAGVRANKFEVKSGAGQNLSNQFPIFRFADILLMKAEALVRQGKNGDPYMQAVRGRAGLGGVAEGKPAGANLNDILAERGRELVWEAHRRQDLIRFGEFGKPWQFKDASTKDREVFLIPRRETSSNPNLLLDPQ